MLLVLFVPGTCFGGVFTKPTHQTEFHHQTAIKAHGAEGVGEFGLLGFWFQGGQVWPQQPGATKSWWTGDTGASGGAQKRWEHTASYQLYTAQYYFISCTDNRIFMVTYGDHFIWIKSCVVAFWGQLLGLYHVASRFSLSDWLVSNPLSLFWGSNWQMQTVTENLEDWLAHAGALIHWNPLESDNTKSDNSMTHILCV